MNKNNTTQNLYVGLSYNEIIKKYNEIIEQEEELREKKRQLCMLHKKRYSEQMRKELARQQREKWRKEQPRDENGNIIVRFHSP